MQLKGTFKIEGLTNSFIGSVNKMKIVFTLFLLCILGFIPVAAQNRRENKTDVEREDLSGEVKKVETHLVNYLPKDGGIMVQKRLWIITEFDTKGRRSERTVHLTDGGTNKDIYSYDAKGDNIECKTYYPDFKDKNQLRVQTYTHTFDDKGNLLERKVFENSGNLSSRFVYEYDEKGNEIEYRNYYHTGLLGGKILSTYDNNGKLLSQIFYKGDGTVSGKRLYVIEKNGRKIKEDIYNGEVLKYKILSEYDEKKRLLQRETFEFNAISNVRTSHAPEAGKVVYIYNDEDKTKEEIEFNANGIAEKKTVYKYDEKENNIEAVFYKYDNSYSDVTEGKNKTVAEQRKNRELFQGKIIYLFEYDTQGNWTKKIRLSQTQESGEPKLLDAEERHITYY